MAGSTCKDWSEIEWRSGSSASGRWENLRESQGQRQPTKSYSKRATHLAVLREKNRWATVHRDEFIQPAGEAAFNAAKDFINNLPEGCLDFRFALSQSGEINFFFGSEADLFQILIDADGTLSYYARERDERFGASDVEARDFPYMRLLQFAERNK